MRARGRQVGQTSVEYLAVIVVAGLVVLLLIARADGFAERIVCEIGSQIAKVGGGGGRDCGGDPVSAGAAAPATSGGDAGGQGATGPRGAPQGPGGRAAGSAGPVRRGPARPRGVAQRSPGSTGPGAASGRSGSRTYARAAAAPRARAARRKRLFGIIPGRSIDTKNYRKKDYEKRYDGTRPVKYEYPMPDFQGRRGGKLRIGLFIKQERVRPGGVAPVEFQGDGRNFDKRFDSLRTRATFVFDFKTNKLTVLVNPSCSFDNSRFTITTCSGAKKGKFTVAAGPNGKGDRSPYSVDYSIKDSRTDVAGFNPAPALDGRITITPIRDKDGRRRLRVTITNDNYPSIEAYYDPSGPKGPRTVCRRTEGYASELAGAATRHCDRVV